MTPKAAPPPHASAPQAAAPAKAPVVKAPPTIAILGLGLIGGSLGAALRQAAYGRVIGYDHSAEHRALAQKIGLVDTLAENAIAAVEHAGIVVLAVPPAALPGLMAELGPHIRRGTLVTDVTSVKQAAVEAMTPHLARGVWCVPAHPIAGSEHSGPMGARADLFQGKRLIATPPPGTPDAAIGRLNALWRAVGSRVEAMSPERHDTIYAHVSHLPQWVSFISAEVFRRQGWRATPSWRDALPWKSAPPPHENLVRFLRLSHSPAPLWRDIFHSNAHALLAAQRLWLHACKDLCLALDAADSSTAIDLMAQASQLHFSLRDSAALIPLEQLETTPALAVAALLGASLMLAVGHAEDGLGLRMLPYSGTGLRDMAAPLGGCGPRHVEVLYRQAPMLLPVLSKMIQRAALALGETTGT